MAISLISIAAKYWWVAAIAALLIALKVQDARLRSALAASASMKSEIATHDDPESQPQIRRR